MLGEELAAPRDPLFRDSLVEVAPKGLGEFGLAPVELDNLGVWPQPGKRRIERGLGNALPAGVGPQVAKKVLEAALGLGRQSA